MLRMVWLLRHPSGPSCSFQQLTVLVSAPSIAPLHGENAQFRYPKKTLSLLQHEDFNALNRTCRFRENLNFRLLLSILNVFNHQNPTSCGWVMLRINQATRVGVFGDRKYQRFQKRNLTFQWFNERMWWYK